METSTYLPSNISTYEYWAKVQKVVDGDTMDFEVSLGFDLVVTKRARLLGVNTPEVWGVKRSSEEYRKGKIASDFVKGLLPKGKWVELKVYKKEREKYGRFLCEVFVDGKSLNHILVDKGYFAEY